MNKKEKRAYLRQAQKNGISKEAAEIYVYLQELGAGNAIPANNFQEGDKVMLNAELIMSRKDYESMNQSYRNFVESNTDTVFTAHVEKEDLISLKEQPEWLFWSGNLKPVTDETKTI